VYILASIYPEKIVQKLLELKETNSGRNSSKHSKNTKGLDWKDLCLEQRRNHLYKIPSSLLPLSNLLDVED
jgi:hypothetical protein